MQFKALAMIAAAFVSTTAVAWPNRAQVIRTAEVLGEEVERFDEALHEVNAPADLIEITHHFEETSWEFQEIARRGSFQEAQAEMAHIRQDVGLMRDKLARYPWVLNYPTVATEWRHVRTAYRQLDHQMFIRNSRLTREQAAQLQAEFDALLDEHGYDKF